MSDTVKIIIELPRIEYEYTCERTLSDRTLWDDAIRKGTPLDDVKAELEKHQYSREYCCDHNIDTAIDMGMVRIILDNIGRKDGK